MDNSNTYASLFKDNNESKIDTIVVDKPTDETVTIIADKITGMVKWFNTRNGYGFITACSGEYVGKDIFVHFSSINASNTQYKYLIQGEYIDFDIIISKNSNHEHQATNVSGVNGGPIMCERPITNSNKRETGTASTKNIKSFDNTDPKNVRNTGTRHTNYNTSKNEYTHPRSKPIAKPSKDGEFILVGKHKLI